MCGARKVAWLSVACLVTVASAEEKIGSDPVLRNELLSMCDVDQKVRTGFGADMDAEVIAQMAAVDAKNIARMKEIVEDHGWPGSSLVGEDGAHAAWLLVQHAEIAFMEHCLPLMEEAVKEGEAAARDYAYLVDRVLMRRGKSQVYGTQFMISDKGRLEYHPIKDPDTVDHRRKLLGLQPQAEYQKQLEMLYKAKPVQEGPTSLRASPATAWQAEHTEEHGKN